MVSVILQFTGSDVTLIRLSLIQVLSCNCKKEKVIFSEPIKRFFDLVKEARKGLSWKMMTIELRSKEQSKFTKHVREEREFQAEGIAYAKFIDFLNDSLIILSIY